MGGDPRLPHNLDAERSVLGAVLLNNHALNIAMEASKKRKRTRSWRCSS